MSSFGGRASGRRVLPRTGSVGGFWHVLRDRVSRLGHGAGRPGRWPVPRPGDLLRPGPSDRRAGGVGQRLGDIGHVLGEEEGGHHPWLVSDTSAAGSLAVGTQSTGRSPGAAGRCPTATRCRSASLGSVANSADPIGWRSRVRSAADHVRPVTSGQAGPAGAGRRARPRPDRQGQHWRPGTGLDRTGELGRVPRLGGLPNQVARFVSGPAPAEGPERLRDPQRTVRLARRQGAGADAAQRLPLLASGRAGAVPRRRPPADPDHHPAAAGHEEAGTVKVSGPPGGGAVFG